MPWYWWVLIYAVGALAVFRKAFLSEMDDYQRAVHKWKMTPSYDRMMSKATIDADHKFGLVLVGTMSVFWPVTVVCTVAYLLWRLVFWTMFPRGIRTKFDQEQQLEREKKEAERKFEEARKLLAKEGINV